MRSASSSAASCVRAPPFDASGLRNGAYDGACVHHAAQKKRPRAVGVIDTTALASSVIGATRYRRAARALLRAHA